jgi:short-subunit dehydrogenase
MANGVGLQNRTALITGASGGIGLELTRLLAADGYHLVMVGRDRERLEDVMVQLQTDHKIAVRCEPRDLCESRAAFQLWADLTTGGIAIDVLVNNAGVGLYGLLEEQNAESLERMLQLNMAARRAAHGGVLCHEGVRAVLLEGSRARAGRKRSERHRIVPWSY